MSSVTVVGAGVIGLCTAVALQEQGHRVRVVAAEKACPNSTAITSQVAGACWYPFLAGPRHRIAGPEGWAARTRRWLIQLARTEPAAGVDLLTRDETTDASPSPSAATPTPPWWASACPDLQLITTPAHTTAHAATWRFIAPRCEPAIFLPWLESRLERPIEISRVNSLSTVPGDAVINCTGLGSRELANDPTIDAIFGQTVIAAPDGFDLSYCPGDERDPAAVFYAIPRRAEVILGGCALPHSPTAPPLTRDDLTHAILARAQSKGFPARRVLRTAAGLRPYRPEVRLERDLTDPRIIHNYGHGGAGFTLAWGCALDVATLLR